jgi:xanthine dehydrogenase accessory factor
VNWGSTLAFVYDVALTVRACLGAGTRVDVAWPVAAEGVAVAADDAIALTPGGGRVGSLLGGALDGQLSEAAAVGTSRLVSVELSEVDALVAGLPQGGLVRCLVVAAADLPASLWDRLVAREPVSVVAFLDGDRVTRTELAEAGDDVGPTRVEDDRVVTVLRPVTKLVIAGAGPIAEAIARAADLLGWRVLVHDDVNEAVGQVTTLSAMDNLVVIGHDDRLTGAALEAALAGPVGYIGSVGPRRLQDSRADWLVRRGVDDLDRIHGPAGLPIGASSPAEIAVSVLAEALAVRA